MARRLVQSSPALLIRPSGEVPYKLIVMGYEIIHITDFDGEHRPKLAQRSDVNAVPIGKTLNGLPRFSLDYSMIAVCDKLKLPWTKLFEPEMLRVAKQPVLRLLDHNQRVWPTRDLEPRAGYLVGDIIPSIYFNIGNPPDSIELSPNPIAILVVYVMQESDAPES